MTYVNLRDHYGAMAGGIPLDPWGQAFGAVLELAGLRTDGLAISLVLADEDYDFAFFPYVDGDELRLQVSLGTDGGDDTILSRARMAAAELLSLLGFAAWGLTPEWRGWWVSETQTLQEQPPETLTFNTNLGGARRARLDFLQGLWMGCNAFAAATPERAGLVAEWEQLNGIPTLRRAVMGHRWPQFYNDISAIERTNYFTSVGKKLRADVPEAVHSFGLWAYDEINRLNLAPTDIYSVAGSDGLEGWSELLPMSPADAQFAGMLAVGSPTAAGYIYGAMAYPPPSGDPTDVGRFWWVWQTAYPPDGKTVEECLDAYREAGATKFILGNYASVWTWGHCQPGRDRGASWEGYDEWFERTMEEGVIGAVDDAGVNLGAARWYPLMAAQARAGSFGPSIISPFGASMAAITLGVELWPVRHRDEFTLDHAKAAARAAEAFLLAPECAAPGLLLERGLDAARYIIAADKFRRFWSQKTSTNLAQYLSWSCRIRSRYLVDYTCPYGDRVLLGYIGQIATAAGWPTTKKLTPFTAPELWGSEVPGREQIMAELYLIISEPA